jgi:S1-C subfamily serine protease
VPIPLLGSLAGVTESDARWGWWPRRHRRPALDARAWVHPSELPRFEDLEPHRPSPRSRLARIIALVAAVLLVSGGTVLLVNRGTPPTTTTTHLGVTLGALPAAVRPVAADTVDLTVITGNQVTATTALVLANDLAVTTLRIPANAVVRGTNASRTNFAVTLVGRDEVMGFSIVHLDVSDTPTPLDPMPASAAVTVVAPVVADLVDKPRYDWAVTTLGDPLNLAQGVVRYLATPTGPALSGFTNAVAVDPRGRVVAVLAASHEWFAAEFVARVADVLKQGRGCHSYLGASESTVQGGGVRVTKLAPHGPATIAGLRSGDVIMRWGTSAVDSVAALRSMLYLTPAYTAVHVQFLQGNALRATTITPVCPFRVTP